MNSISLSPECLSIIRSQGFLVLMCLGLKRSLCSHYMTVFGERLYCHREFRHGGGGRGVGCCPRAAAGAARDLRGLVKSLLQAVCRQWVARVHNLI